MEDELARHYLNGVDPVVSEGEREGMTWGASVQVGWERPLYKRVSMMPYLGYEQTWISLEGYEETSGPFPAIFDKVSDTTKVSRLGMELSMPVRETMRVYADVAWAHQYDELKPAVSGSVPLLSSAFNLPGGPVNEDWAEVELGASGRIADNIRLNLSMGAMLDEGDDLGYTGMIGLTIFR
jgi:outer membrane autotransporter protein